ncbi:MAG TPA: hypothetical protein PLY61_17120 [Anaerohalosphaeraceae bacterium]|nr:hypothetical protein [Anaerohalosphaeraceae bacterium]
MAFFPTRTGAGANVAAGLPSRGWAPPVFADRLMRLFREATFTDVTTVNPPGELTPTKSGNLGYIFTWEAYVRSLPMIQGRDLITQFPESKDVEWIPQRAQYTQIGTTRKQRRESRWDLSGEFLASGMQDFAKNRFKEYLDFCIQNAGTYNKGATVAVSGGPALGYGGRLLGKVLLGTPTLPVILFKDQAALTASSATGPKMLAVDFVASLDVALSEQIGGDGGDTVMAGATLFDQQRSTDSFVYYPALLNTYCKLSDKAISATAQDERRNSLFGDVMWLNSTHLGGWTRAIKTNLLPTFVTDGTGGASFAPAGVRVIPIIFGQNRSVMATPPYTDSDRQIKDQKNLVDVDRDVRYYDFFAAFPNFLGVAYVTFDEYAAQTA